MSDPAGRSAEGRSDPDQAPQRDEPATGTSGSSGDDSDRRESSRRARAAAAGIDPDTVDAGHYRIVSEIARGGMGVVFRGRDIELCRDVAIKVVHAEIAAEPALRERFVEEAQIGGQLQHPGIVPVYELGVLADERPYFAMKLVKGETLTALLRACEDRSKELHRFVAIFESICQTMAYAHSRGVIHRDLKPSNVMVGPFGEVQLVDWGLAKVISEPGVPLPTIQEPGSEVSSIATIRSASTTTSSGSVAGSVMGTVAYMSPEQARGEIDELDERTDVFALGGILCEILTGAAPYPGKRAAAFELALRSNQEELAARLGACCEDATLVELARACLAPDPAARPKDAGVVAERVGAWQSAVEERARTALVAAAEARGKAAEERHARRLAVGLACSAVLTVLLAAGGWAWWERQQGERERATEQRVAAALSEASFARGRSEWSAADAALARARAHLDAGVATEAQRVRVRDEEMALAEAVAADELAAAREARRQEFIEQVETVRERVERTNVAKIEGYADAFERHGIAVGRDPDRAVAEAILGSGAELEMASALMDWARLLTETEGRSTDQVRRLQQLALSVDDDPQRSRLRRAVLAKDRIEIVRLSDEVEQDPAVVLPPITAIVLADALWSDMQEERAIAVLRRAEREHPNDFHLHVKLATRYLNNQRYAQALPHVKAAEALRPKSAWVLTHLAVIYLEQDEPELALEYAGRAVDADPDSAFAHHHLGACLAAAGELDAAIGCYYTALDIAPEYIFAIRRLAGALDVQGNSEAATEFFRQAVALQPADADVLNSLAWHLATANDPAARRPDEALELADRCVALEADASNLNTQGVCRYRAGDFEGALDSLERSIQIATGGGSVEDLLFLSMTLHRLGREDEAAQRYDAGRQLMQQEDPSPAARREYERYASEAAELLGRS